jgi:hypothetical protein
MDFKKAIYSAQPVTADLIQQLSLARWCQRIINESHYPICINRIPASKRLFAMGSGDLLLPMEFSIGSRFVDAIAGLDSFRYDGDDEAVGTPVNRDNFIIVRNLYRPDLESKFLSLGPFTPEKNHRLPDIPPETYDIPLLH